MYVSAVDFLRFAYCFIALVCHFLHGLFIVNVSIVIARCQAQTLGVEQGTR